MNCRFWDRAFDEGEEKADWGFCRRFPPAYESKLDQEGGDVPGAYMHPCTTAMLWCGEFKVKEAK